MSARKEPPLPSRPTGQEVWELRLYVAGRGARAAFALANLKTFCAHNLPGRYHLRVIDIQRHPAAAKANQIIATPTLVRTSPKPMRTFLGDLSDLRHAGAALGFQPA